MTIKSFVFCAALVLSSVTELRSQPGTVHITDTVYDGGGNLVIGTCSYWAAGQFTSSGVQVVGEIVQVPITNGAMDFHIVRTDNATPSGQFYNVRCTGQSGYRATGTWVVGGTAAHLSDIWAFTAPSPTQTFLLSQIGNVGTSGQAICSNGTAWVAGSCGGSGGQVNSDWNSVSGVSQILNRPTLGGAALLNVGTTSGTVAAGNHNHTGVYEPVDTTILRQGNLAGSGTAVTPARSDHNHTGVYQPALGFTAENVAHKGAVSGYAGLNTSGYVFPAQLGTGTANSSTCLHGDSSFGSCGGGSLPSGTPNLIVATDPAGSSTNVSTLRLMVDADVPNSIARTSALVLTPQASKVPLADGTGKISADWVPTSVSAAGNSIPKSQSNGLLSMGYLAAGTPNGTLFVRDDGNLANPNASMPRANLLVEYALDAGGGKYVNNSVYPAQPNYNLIGPSEQQYSNGTWLGSGNTFTDIYAPNRNGDFIASRLQVSAGGFIYMTYPYTAGVTYTLSIWISSNTGSVQHFRMSDDQIIFGSDITIPATGWFRYTSTFTATASGYVVPIKTDVAADALDILIDSIQLEVGPHATTYVPQFFHMILGGAPQQTSSQPAWTTAGLDFTVNSGNTFTSSVSWTPLSTSTITVYAASKWTGSEFFATYAPILSSPGPFSSGHLFIADDFVTGGQAAFGFSSTSVTGYNSNTNDGQWHILTGSYDGSNNLSIYVDGVLVRTDAVGVLAPIFITKLLLSSFDGSAFFPGTIGYAAVYSVSHSVSQVQLNTSAIRSLMASRGVIITPPLKFVSHEGDSITAANYDFSPALKYPSLADTTFTPILAAMSPAIAGNNLANLASRQATVAAALNMIPATSQRVLTVLVGANDGTNISTGTFISNYTAYITYMHANVPGLKIIVCTILPRTLSGFNAWRNTVNTAILSGIGQDATCDFAGNSNMGPDAAASNTTYYSDGLHPTTAGHVILGGILVTALHAVGL